MLSKSSSSVSDLLINSESQLISHQFAHLRIEMINNASIMSNQEEIVHSSVHLLSNNNNLSATPHSENDLEYEKAQVFLNSFHSRCVSLQQLRNVFDLYVIDEVDETSDDTDEVDFVHPLHRISSSAHSNDDPNYNSNMSELNNLGHFESLRTKVRKYMPLESFGSIQNIMNNLDDEENNQKIEQEIAEEDSVQQNPSDAWGYFLDESEEIISPFGLDCRSSLCGGVERHQIHSQ